MRRSGLFAATVVLSLTLAACGSSKTSTSSSSTSAPSATGASSGNGTTLAAIPVADRSAAGTSKAKPKVTVPSGPPPSVLETADLIPGSGAAAKAGDNLTVQYVGVSYTTKQEFDSSWSRNQPFSFGLGQGQVIKGWDQGLVGMKVGGRRELIIPADLAYGAQSPGAGIPANDTLIFIVDLVSIS